MRELLKKILSIEDPSKRRAMFSALFSKEVVRRGGKPPIVVGGEAVELYTQGGYTTGDIDIKSPLEITKSVLKEWGFSKKGRTWFNQQLDIYIDWLGASLDEGQEAEDRVTTIRVAKGLEIRVISIEDLVIDRLNAAKYWGDVDSLMWARVLLGIKKEFGEKIELNYLKKRAKREGITDFLSKALSPDTRR
jgi:acyl carrier protein